MRTLAQYYAEKNGCPEEECARRLFHDCLHRRAYLAFPSVLMMFNPMFFSADQDLLEAASRSSSLAQLDRAIMDFQSDSRNYDWWRRRAGLRVSVRRLRRIARALFPRQGGTTPPFGSNPPTRS